jgi:hypothetical protein
VPVAELESVLALGLCEETAFPHLPDTDHEMLVVGFWVLAADRFPHRLAGGTSQFSEIEDCLLDHLCVAHSDHLVVCEFKVVECECNLKL